ncbi:unnamed protein product, partial [Meganyctiphanes norvegica]
TGTACPKPSVGTPPMPTGAQPLNVIRPQPVSMSAQPCENNIAIQPFQSSAFHPVQHIQQLVHLQPQATHPLTQAAHSQPKAAHPQPQAAHQLHAAHPQPQAAQPQAAQPQPQAPQPQAAHLLPQAAHPQLQAAHPHPQAAHPQPQAAHPQPQATHPQPAHPQLQAAHPQPQAAHLQPQSAHPQLQAAHLQPQVVHPQLQAPYPQQAAHPQPQAIHQEQLAAHQSSGLPFQQAIQSVSQTIQSAPNNSHSELLIKQSLMQEQFANLSPQPKILENVDDLCEHTEFQAGAGIPVSGGSAFVSGPITRSQSQNARQPGLMHSASDPGIVKQSHVRQPSQYTKNQESAHLDNLREEEEDDVNLQDTLDGYIKANRGRPRLHRSDSIVTVAHLYEDIMVSPRLGMKVTLTNLTVVVLLGAFVCPNTAMMLYTIFRLLIEQTRNLMIPIVFNFQDMQTTFSKAYRPSTVCGVFLIHLMCWLLPFGILFYYLKILVVLWLLSPATRGSSILYRKFVHPWLTRREEDIDECIAKAKQQGYSTVIQLGTKGVNYATTVLMQTAIKGGGGIVNQLRRTYSAGELNEGDLNRNVKALPQIGDNDDYDGQYDISSHLSGTDEPRHIRSESDGGFKPRGSSTSRVARSSGKTRSADVAEYYQDVPEDTTGRRRSPRSTQDSARSQPTLHFQEPQKGQPRKRGKSENRPRPKSMINAQEVTRGAEWARAQRLGSTLSLTSEVEMSESSSHSSLASIPAAGSSQGHSVRPKQRTGSTRRRVDSQGRKTSSISRSASRPNVPSTKTQRSTLEVASDTE